MSHDLANLKGMHNIGQYLESAESMGCIQIKETASSLSKIQIGDLLQGALIVDGEQFVLKLESGLKLLTNLPKNILFNKKLDFEVVGKDGGRLLLKCVHNEVSEKSGTNIVDQTLQELSLKDTPEMRQIIEQFVEKQLPFIKEQLIQLLHFSRNYTIPTEVLTNLVSENQMPRQEDMEILTNLKEQGIKALFPTWEKLIETLMPEQSRQLAKFLLNLLNPPEVKHVLQKTNLVQYEEEVSKNLIEFVSHPQLSRLNKALIEECLVVHLNQIGHEEKSEMEKMTEMNTRLKQIAKGMKEVRVEGSEEVHLAILEKTIEVLDKYKMQGQYFYFPLQLKEHQITGELYFLKSKNHKTRQKSGICIVLALNMPALHKIEVHLVEKSCQMTLKIKVENEVIKAQLKEHESVLLEMMNAGSIPLKKIEIELLSEKQQKLKSISNELYGLDLKI